MTPTPTQPPPEPFSILGRIGGDATFYSVTPSGLLADCLSVSSVGSEAMQRYRPDRVSREIAPFSILGRIGGDATRETGLPDRQRCALSVSSVGSEAMQRWGRSDGRAGESVLSVSSVGSEAMQPAPDAEPGRRLRPFQYPRSDRRRCNHPADISLRCLHLQLSVSSVGSEAMQQHRVADVDLKVPGPFSILGRIGGDATRKSDTDGDGWSDPFSILGRIGGDATRP